MQGAHKGQVYTMTFTDINLPPLFTLFYAVQSDVTGNTASEAVVRAYTAAAQQPVVFLAASDLHGALTRIGAANLPEHLRTLLAAVQS